MEIDEETVRTLAELGFIAGDYGMSAQAEAIAGALESLRPASERPHIIEAYSRIWARDTDGAERILRERALQKNPDSSEAKAVLGLALHLSGKSAERDRVLNEVVSAADNQDAVSIAERLIGAPARG